MSMELIGKDKIKYLPIPIAPVLVGEDVHYEMGALKEWIDDMPTVKAIPLEVVEQIKEEMQELIDWHDCPIEYDNGNDYWYCQAVNQCISKLDKALKEQNE